MKGASTSVGGPAADAAHHRTAAELEAGFDRVLASPGDGGTLEMIVRRPGTDRREVINEGQLTFEAGLEGDTWRLRDGYVTEDGAPDPDAQLTLTNSRFADLIAGSRDLWPLAGDQLYVDLDLERRQPATRCQAPARRGVDRDRGASPYRLQEVRPALSAPRPSSSLPRPRVRRRNLRGIYARVVEPGTVRVGDTVHRIG